MTAADRLDEIEARANAATEGPWFVSDDAVWVDRGEGNADGITGPLAPWCFGEADFIAHSRTDVPWLIEQVRKRDAALQAVLDLHAPEPYCGNTDHDPNLCPCSIMVCADEYEDTYPCPTVRAIDEALK